MDFNQEEKTTISLLWESAIFDAIIFNSAFTNYIIVPFAIASLTTGLIISSGTRWGLLRHYWVFFKFLINTIALPILFLHTSIIHRVSAAAKNAPLLPTDLHQDRLQLVIAAAAALAALLIATFLSVYKPRGLMPTRKEMKRRF